MKKNNRQEKVIEIINKYDVETQEQLASLLKEAGFDVTQATVSRDIRELRLTKIATDYGRQKYRVIEQDSELLQDKYIQVLRSGYVSMERAENILVLKTVSGMAMAVAAALDALKIPQILGCIAGDDTIFVAIRTHEDALEVMTKIREMTRN